VAGRPEQAYAATRAITLAEMPLARTLFTIRGLSAKSSAPVNQVKDPLLSQMLARGFSVLVDRPGSEFVIGAIAQPWRLRGGDTVPLPTPTTFVEFHGSGYVKMAKAFATTRRATGLGSPPRPGCWPPTPPAAAPSPGTGCRSGPAAA